MSLFRKRLIFWGGRGSGLFGFGRYKYVDTQLLLVEWEKNIISGSLNDY